MPPYGILNQRVRNLRRPIHALGGSLTSGMRDEDERLGTEHMAFGTSHSTAENQCSRLKPVAGEEVGTKLLVLLSS